MQAFCIAFAFKPLEVTSDITLKAIGKSKEFFFYGTIKKIGFVLFLIISVAFGTKAIAVGFVSASILATIISVVANKKEFKLSIKKQFENLLKPLVLAFLMCIIVVIIGKAIENLPIILILIIQIICGIAIYLILIKAFDKETFNYLVGAVKQFFVRGKKE